MCVCKLGSSNCRPLILLIHVEAGQLNKKSMIQLRVRSTVSMPHILHIL